MKKLLPILLTLVLLFSLCACSSYEKFGVGDYKTNYANDEERAVCEVAESFLESWQDWNFATLKNYITRPEKLMGYTWDIHLNIIIKEQLGGIPAEYAGYSRDVKEAYTNLLVRGRNEMTCKINNIEKNSDDAYTLTVTVTEADVATAFLEQHEKEQETLLEELKNANIITDDMTEDEQNRIFVPENVKLFMKIADTVEFESSTKSKKLIVVKKDGKWLIDFDASDFKLV